LPYEVEAPRSALISNLTVKGNMADEGGTAVVHLINHTGSREERILQNLYHLPPVDNVTVRYRLPAGTKLEAVRLFVPADFSSETTGDVVHVRLPRIDAYQAVSFLLTATDKAP